jgi:hypothetical protein
MLKAGFFRIWVCRPSTAFGSSSSYESGYLWSLYVSDGTTTSGIMPKGYVVNSMWTGTGSTARIFSSTTFQPLSKNAIIVSIVGTIPPAMEPSFFRPPFRHRP